MQKVRVSSTSRHRLRISKQERLRSCGSTVAPTSKVQAALDTADRYAGNAHAQATKRAYRSDWAHFGDWC